MMWIIGALLMGVAQANDRLPWSMDSPEAVVYMALLPRHPHKSCAEISLNSSEPVATLNAVVHGPSLPPWVPMRAASCLVELHLEAAEEEITAWLLDPEMMGLARLVQRRLSDMPTPIASRMKSAALTGPHHQVFQAPKQPMSP